MSEKKIIEDLGDGLILRYGIPEDVEELADFNSRVHSDEGWDQPEEFLKHWTRDLMNGHPTVTPEDFTVVEDTKTGKLVSTVMLIPQQWSYGGVPFNVGRPELVATHPDYRRKGLVRKQFEAIHARSAANGDLLNCITGIPNYYRQFGYEMTVPLGGGRRSYQPHILKLKDDEEETVVFRLATLKDIPFLKETYDYGAKRHLLSCLRDETLWEYELTGRSEGARIVIKIIEDRQGIPLGFLLHPNKSWGSTMGIILYELKKGVSWLEISPAVMRHMWNTGEELAAQEDDKPLARISWMFSRSHPLFEVLPDYLPEVYQSYAWYLRVPDLPALLKKIGPVLEERIAGSFAPGYSGKMMLNFYTNGIKLVFEKGKLNKVESWQPSTDEEGHVKFPGLNFLQLLFGHYSMDELEAFYPDCYMREKYPEGRLLMATLFPRIDSTLYALQ